MRRILLSAAAALTLVVPAGHANAASCVSLVCVSATIGGSTGTCGSPSYTPYPHQHCQWLFSWSATGTGLTPGNLNWTVTPPDSEVHGTYNGGCAWTLPTGCTSPDNSGWQVAAVPCGGTRTITAYINATASDVGASASTGDSSSLTLYAPPC
jgi:hypothetical protein